MIPCQAICEIQNKIILEAKNALRRHYEKNTKLID